LKGIRRPLAAYNVVAHADGKLTIGVDEVRELGYFIEIEGRLSAVRDMEKKLQSCLGLQESKNYAELFRAYKLIHGKKSEDIKGAEFR
jgi:adenylate cyclase class IV